MLLPYRLGMGPLGGSALLDDFVVTLDNVGAPDASPIIEIVSAIGPDIIKSLYRDPEQLKTIGHRQFEELVAELFDGFGYDVELTQQTRDGGKDIIAIKRREFDLRVLIECKRPSAGKPVTLGAVRELSGVRDDDRATKAILATTSYFSPDGRRFEERNRWQLELKDYEAIKEWLQMYLSLKGGD